MPHDILLEQNESSAYYNPVISPSLLSFQSSVHGEFNK